MTCPSCWSCGMALENGSNEQYCAFCTDENGRLKPYQDILNGMSDYLVHSQGLDRGAAEEIAKDVLAKQPAWEDQ